MREGGVIKLYALKNVSEPGFMPTEKLVFSQGFYCSLMTTGVTRRYAAMGANRNYSVVVRCWNCPAGFGRLPDDVKYAIDEDGIQYLIDIAEPIYDQDALDLTLIRLEDLYDVAIEA